MKYTMRHVQKFISQGKIDPVLWQNHFPHALGSKVPACEDCEDHLKKVCEGGKDPVDCFLAIGVRAEVMNDTEGGGTSRKMKRLPQWTPTGRDQRIPHGANKTYDQSKT